MKNVTTFKVKYTFRIFTDLKKEPNAQSARHGSFNKEISGDKRCSSQYLCMMHCAC